MDLLEDLKSDKIVIMMTHHLQFLKRVDHVSILLNGSIVENGRPTDLMAQGGLFAEYLKRYGFSHDDNL